MQHSSVSWEITLLHFFSRNFIWSGQKETIIISKFQTLSLTWNFTKFYFDGLFLLKVYKISAKKVQRIYVSWHWRLIRNLKKNQFAVANLTRIRWILTWALKILKISTLIGSFFPKCVTFDLKKSRWVIFHDTKEWCKIWRKTDLWFGEWLEEYGKFSPEHLKNHKIGTLVGSFYPKQKMHELKIYRGIMCHDNEKWFKIWRGIDLLFQNWPEEFDKLWPKHSKVSNVCTLMGAFWSKYIMFELKKYRGVMFKGSGDWCKILRKTDLSFKNDMSNLADFHRLKNGRTKSKSKFETTRSTRYSEKTLPWK